MGFETKVHGSIIVLVSLSYIRHLSDPLVSQRVHVDAVGSLRSCIAYLFWRMGNHLLAVRALSFAVLRIACDT